MTERLLSKRAVRLESSAVRDFLKRKHESDVVFLAGGLPDPALFPKEAFARASIDAFRDTQTATGALQYAASEGFEPLRSLVVARMAREGVFCDRRNVLITSGSQQALDLVARVLIDEGDTIAATTPTYLGALQAFSGCAPSYVTIERDGDTLTLSTRERVKFAYVVPDFANPTGETLDRQAREKILDLAHERDFLVLEDGAYRGLRYEGEDEPMMAALDQIRTGDIERSRVLYCGTFSKTLSPGLRVGFVCGPSALIDKLVVAKQAGDLHSATLNQMLVASVMIELDARYFGRLRETYRERRDAMLAALDRHAEGMTRYTRPAGGMFVWMELDADIDTGALMEACVERAGVAYVPGFAFHPDGRGRNTLRLSFSLETPQRIERGVASLMSFLRSR